MLYEHFYELITESGEHKQNLQIVRSKELISRIFYMIQTDLKMLHVAKDVLFNLLAALLQPLPDENSMLKFGQFICSTLPGSNSTDYELNLPREIRAIQDLLFADESKSELFFIGQ